MGLLGVASLKGSPGATTTALALAACWPDAPAPTVVECDPAGGDVAARYRMPARPGLAEVAAAAASVDDADAQALAAGCQTITVAGTQVGLVAAPPGGAGVAPALAVLAAPEMTVLRPAASWVIADLGRLDVDSPAWPLTAIADGTVIVVEGSVAAVAHLRARAADLQDAVEAGACFTIVVAPGPYRAEDVSDVFSAAGFGLHIAGPTGRAAAVATDPIGWRGRRTLRAWRKLAATIAAAVTADAPHGAAVTSAGGEAARS